MENKESKRPLGYLGGGIMTHGENSARKNMVN